MRLLDRYLLSEWAKVFTLCLVALGGIQILSVLYNYAPDFLAWDSDVITVLEFLALRSFGGVHLLVPISLLLSVIYVLGSLNRNSELAAIRAAGVGMWRLTAPLWAVGFVSAALLALAGAFLVPDAMEAERELLEREQFRALRSQGVVAATAGNAEFVSFENARARRLWLIARLGVTAGQAFEVTVHGFDSSGREVRTIT
ncbi:MAG: LptF/LptG family permease, partial [Verrucomicrobiota bacterium]